MSAGGAPSGKQQAKVFVGGLSWETTGEKLRAYFENFGAVREAFVSYNRTNGRPRGFGFVVFESPEVADKVVAAKHTIDRREVGRRGAGRRVGLTGTRQPSSLLHPLCGRPCCTLHPPSPLPNPPVWPPSTHTALPPRVDPRPAGRGQEGRAKG